MASPSLQALGRALKNLPNLGAAGDVQGMREVVEAAENRLPAYWQTQGRLILRITTLKAIDSSKISVVQYLCEERGMPPLAAAPEVFGKLVLAPSSPRRFSLNIIPSGPIIIFHNESGACSILVSSSCFNFSNYLCTMVILFSTLPPSPFPPPQHWR